MENKSFDIYTESTSSLKGEFKDGCLHITSEVWGEYDSEQHITFSKEETDKLFSLITLDEFISLCKKEHIIGLNTFLDDNNIKRNTITI